MESFYNNRGNGKADFKLNLVGATPDKMKMRLVFESQEGTMLSFIGAINEKNICTFNIPAIGLDKGQKGKLYIEAIYENELYFEVWNDTFAIESKTEIKVDESIQRSEVPMETKEKQKVEISLDEGKLIRTKVDEKINESEVKDGDVPTFTQV